MVFEVLQPRPGGDAGCPDLLYDRAMVAEKLDRLDVVEKDSAPSDPVKPDYAHATTPWATPWRIAPDRLPEALER